MFEEKRYGGGVLEDASGCGDWGSGDGDGVAFGGQGSGIDGGDAVAAAVEECKGEGEEGDRKGLSLASPEREDREGREEECPV